MLDGAVGRSDGVQLGNPPVVVAVAFGRSVGEAPAVGRPIVFVDVGVGRGNLTDGAGRNIDEREALFEDLLLDDAFVFGGRLKRAGNARRVFGEQEGDGLTVR